MNWFLDMCILIFYANPSESMSGKTRAFLKRKGNHLFVVCHYITDNNLPKWIEREKIALQEIKKYFDNPRYNIGTSEDGKKLFKEDVIDAKKMADSSLKKMADKERAYKLLKINQELLINNLNYFSNKLIDKIVIPVEEIDFELKSTLFTFLQNHSDAMTLASGIQHAQKEEIQILTGDKYDWNKNNLEWTFDSRPDLAKKYPKVPEIKYIQNL